MTVVRCSVCDRPAPSDHVSTHDDDIYCYRPSCQEALRDSLAVVEWG